MKDSSQASARNNVDREFPSPDSGVTDTVFEPEFIDETEDGCVLIISGILGHANIK